mgnify:CR=1 FL=1
MRLDHRADDPVLAGSQLRRDVAGDIKLAPEITVRPTPEFTAEQNALAQSLQELNLPEAQLTKLADQIAAFVSTAQLDAVRQGIQSAVDMMNDESYLPE